LDVFRNRREARLAARLTKARQKAMVFEVAQDGQLKRFVPAKKSR